MILLVAIKLGPRIEVLYIFSSYPSTSVLHFIEPTTKCLHQALRTRLASVAPTMRRPPIWLQTSKTTRAGRTASLQIMASSNRTPTTGSRPRLGITLARCCWKTTWLAKRFTASTTSAFLNASSMHVALVHSAPSSCTRAWRGTPAQRFLRIPPAVPRFFSAAQPFSVAVVARTLFAMFVDLPLSSTPKRVSKPQEESARSLCTVRGPRIHYRLLPSICKGFQSYLTLH